MQKEKRTSYLKIYRQGDPLTCQRIWDLIKDLRVERKLAATKENVVQEYCKKYNVEGKFSGNFSRCIFGKKIRTE